MWFYLILLEMLIEFSPIITRFIQLIVASYCDTNINVGHDGLSEKTAFRALRAIGTGQSQRLIDELGGKRHAKRPILIIADRHGTLRSLEWNPIYS